MANNAPSLHRDATGAIAAASSQLGHVSLRVITLTHGSDREADSYLVLDLGSSVEELKESLRQHLSQHPQPDHQRLIYQGRPLLDNGATLRSVLRLDPSTSPPPVHVLHLVIREQQPSTTNPSSATRPQTTQPGIQPIHVPPTPRPGQTPLPPNIPHPGMPGLTAAQQMMQNQMQAMQQHMAMHNQHMANAHPGLPQAHLRGMLPFQSVPGAGAGMIQPGAQARTLTSTPNSEARPGTPGGMPLINQLPQVIQAGMSTRVHETIGPNGERIRTVINTQGPFPPNHPAPPQANPVERSASAPGTVHRPNAPLPTAAVSGQDTAGAHPAVHAPTIPMIPNHFARAMMNPFGMQHLAQPQSQTANPTVWLLSSSAGPQALVFAPGHGYFSTTPSMQPTGTEASHSSSSTNQPTQPTPAQLTTHGTSLTNETNQPRAEIVLRPAQGQNQAPAAPRPQQREAEDILAFLLQRGWLFLRLYMFIYVLSESGTWRRLILLSIAVFVCLLPRQNPLTDAFNVIRRHVDNLIGPPQAPQRQTPAQQPEHAQNNDAGPNQSLEPANEATRRAQNMPTPEEHARRLLREHQAQNPSFVRGILHSAEQAVALFLASLIPGVGERHVRAREEARRIVQEEEGRRREAETSNVQLTDEQQTQTPVEPSAESSENTNQGLEHQKTQEVSVTSPDADATQHPAGTSTSIDPSPTVSSTSNASRADAEGVRRRADANSASSSDQVT